MAAIADNPVGLAWIGLGAMTGAIVILAAVRGPVFPDAARASAPGASSAEVAGEGEGSRSEKGDKSDKSEKPAASGKPGTWTLPSLPGKEDPEKPTALPSAGERDAMNGFLDRVRRNDLKGSVTALEALAGSHPNALKDKEVREQIVELSQRVMLLQGDEPQRMFDVLSSKTGTTGIDILYYLVTSKGGSRAAKAAERILADPKVVERGTEAMQVAWALRNAKCEDKRKYFARAGEHGDIRTLGQLSILNRSCGRRNRGCCMHKDPDLVAAIDAMEARGFRQ
jgi:hypothetical protein